MRGYADTISLMKPNQSVIQLKHEMESIKTRNEQMETRNNSMYFGNQEWLKDVVVEPVVLRGVSALEYLGYFSGWFGEKDIDVYSTVAGRFSNVRYHVLPNYDNIDFIVDGHIKCSTFEQAINDLLSEYETTDPQVLMEGLGDYYEEHNQSFDGLHIARHNQSAFDEISEWAKEYYCDE